MTNQQLKRIHRLVDYGRLNEALDILERVPVAEQDDWYEKLWDLIEAGRVPVACIMIERRLAGLP